MARPNNSDAQNELERRRLSEIALGLFRKHGYEAVSLRKVAAEAGVSHSHPYSYFRSREDLFAYLRAGLVNQLCAFMLEPAANVAGSLARIRISLQKFVEFVIAHPEEYRLLFSLRQPDPRKYPELLQSRERLFSAMVDVFQQATDEGLLHGDAANQAHIAWATVHGLLSLHSSNQLVHGRELFTLIAPAIDQLLGLSVEKTKSVRGNNFDKSGNLK